MQHRELAVPEELTQAIRGFWYRDIDFGEQPWAFEVLPDGHAELIFHFGNGCHLVRDGQFHPLPSPFIVSLLQQPVHFGSTGRLQIIGIKCLPWAVYDLFGLEAVKGGVQNVAYPIAALQSRLEATMCAGLIEAAMTIVVEWFLDRKTNLLPELHKAGQMMLSTHGSSPVSSVADAAHATVRTLERKFKASSGHTLKDISGLIRFEQARDRVWAQPDTAIAGLAAELGYADQSHLNREFKRYSGMTAKAFAKRKKDLGDDFVAIVLSS